MIQTRLEIQLLRQASCQRGTSWGSIGIYKAALERFRGELAGGIGLAGMRERSRFTFIRNSDPGHRSYKCLRRTRR